MAAQVDGRVRPCAACPSGCDIRAYLELVLALRLRAARVKLRLVVAKQQGAAVKHYVRVLHSLAEVRDGALRR